MKAKVRNEPLIIGSPADAERTRVCRSWLSSDETSQFSVTSSLPKVTVGITTYNRSHLLRFAIESVLIQTYRNLEIYIVDDNSTDDTRATVESYADSRIVYLLNKINSGVSSCRNRVLARSKGEYIAFLDDDDTWSVDKLERQVHLAKARGTDYAVIYCGCVVVDENRVVINENTPRMRGRIRQCVAAGQLVTIPSAHLFRTGALREIGGYDTALRSHVEHDIWMAMARRDYSADYVDAPLVEVGAHSGYRLTADVIGRWNATDLYLNKWRPWLASWMGSARAKAYEQRYRVKVMSSVSRESIKRHDFRGATRALVFFVALWPKDTTVRAVLGFVWRTLAGIVVDHIPAIRRLLRILANGRN